MDRMFEEVFSRTSQFPRFLNSHHTAPLTYYPQMLVVEAMKGDVKALNTPVVKSAYTKVMSIRKANTVKTVVSVDYCKVMSFCLTQCTVREARLAEPLRKKLETALTVSLNVCRSEVRGIEAQHPYMERNLSKHLRKLTNVSILVDEISPCYALLDFLTVVRNEAQRKACRKDYTWSDRRYLEFQFSISGGDLLLVRDMTVPSRVIILNYDQLLMMIDTVSARTATRLTCLMSDILKTEPLPPWSIIREIYSWGDRLIDKYGARGMAVIGSFEDLVTTMFVNFPGSDPIGLGKQHTECMFEKARETYEEYGVSPSYTEELLSILSKVNCPNQLSEIFGLRKHWGNPMVDANKSGNAVQEKLDEELPVSAEGLLRLKAAFNRMFTMAYIKKHGVWPDCEFPETMSECPLAKAQRSRSTRMPELDINHKHEHWAELKFKPMHVLDPYKNPLRLVSDKSVSLPRSKLDSIYERSCQNNPPSKDVAEQRRLILEFLRKDQIPIEDIFKIIMTGNIPEEWLANSSAMKGTEMKYEKARIFAVLVYELRQYFAATEEMIKESIFPYNPHQTMTMSEVDLLSRLREVTSQMDPDSTTRFVHVIHIIDFSKWNLRMKYSNTSGIFKSIDDILGTPGLIEMSHLIFAAMANIVQDRYCPPQDGVLNTISDAVWWLHTRGWEGQRQKGWTALTSALLSDMERITGIYCEICGQGDNQVLLTKFKIPDEYVNPDDWIKRNPEEIRKVFDDYYQKLEQVCLSVGLKIKTGESCRSLAYLNYGKRLYFLGNELSMMLKRLSKLTTEPNDTIPTTESLLKTMNASGTAVNIYSHPSILPVIVGNFFNCMQLQTAFTHNQLIEDTGQRLLESRGLSLNTRILTILMEIPPTLGGIPTQTITANLFRGHPDTGSEDFCALKTRLDGGDEIAKRIMLLARDKSIYNERDEARNKESLIFAPYSLNLKLPSSATSPLTRLVEKSVSQYCKNHLVQGLFSAELNVDNKSVISWLSSTEPYHPLVVNDIFARTVSGCQKSFVTGLSNATSLTRIIRVDPDNSILEQVILLEEAQIEWWIMLIEKIGSMNLLNVAQSEFQAHHIEIQNARELSWGCPIVGVTTPHACEQFSLTSTEHACCTAECEVYLPEHIVLVYMSDDLISVYGPPTDVVQLNRMRGHSPYMGNKVSEGIMNRQIVCLTPDESFFDSVRLNTLLKWVASENTHLSHGLRQLIKSRTDVPIAIIDQATGTPSRLSHNHRAGLMSAKKTCAPASTTNIFSRMSISSNLMGRFSHGENNYSMPYGAAFLSAQALIALKKVYDDNPRPTSNREVIHFHVRRDDVPIVYDGKLNTSSRLTLIGSSKNNPYFSSCYDLQLSRGSSSVLKSLWRDYLEVSLEHSKIAYATQLIGNSVVEEISVRERIVMSVRSEFVPRESLISIGDMRMVGVRNLVRALSLQLLLMMPYRVINLRTQSEFTPSVVSILDNFSDGFWSQFTKAFINPRLISSLIELTRSAIHSFSTRSHIYLNNILKIAVAEDMWSLRQGAFDSLTTGSLDSPWFLIAPTDASARYLYSKWVELHIIMGGSFSPKPYMEICALARDFSHNILSMEVESFETVIYVMKVDFSSIFSDVTTVQLVIPDPVFLKLGDPWVERIRDVAPTITVPPPLLETRPSTMISQNPLHISYSNPEGLAVEIPIGMCSCASDSSQLPFRSELFFMKNGLLSKSHYRFFDVLFAKVQTFTSVICLGTSTASEAAAFSRIDTNERVYVNCMNDLRKFSPHAAATYSPSAFSVEGVASKLVMSTEATLASNDLLKQDCIQAVIRHTSAYEWSGVTCDAELEFGASLEDRMTLLGNVIKIVIRRVVVGGWLCIKLPIYCNHELSRFVTLLSRHFSTVYAERSYFTNHNHQILMLTGVDLRANIIADLTTATVISGIPHQFDDDFFPKHVRNIRPLLCSASTQVLNERLALGEFMEESILVCRNMFLRGWTDSLAINESNRRNVLQSLYDYRKSMLECVPEILFSNNRVFRNESLPRSNMLTVSSGPLVNHLQNILNCAYRSELLISLLQLEVIGFDKLLSVITLWMSSIKSYYLCKTNIIVKLNGTRFVQHFSRYLFEIVGTFFNHKFTDDSVSIPITTSLHLVGLRQSSMLYGTHLPASLLRVPAPQPINLKWMWPRRAQLLFCLMAAQTLGYTAVCDIRFSHIIHDLKGRYPSINYIKAADEDPSNINTIIYEGSSSSTLLRKIRTFPSVVCINLQLLPWVFSHFKVLEMTRVPWTGTVPNVVSLTLLGMLREPSQPSGEPIYPDFQDINYRFFTEGLGLINCGCYSCAKEIQISQHFDISSSVLNRVCSLGKVRSVRDQRHY